MSIISVFPGKGKPKLATGSATPLETSKTYTPGAAYDGYSAFTVDAIPSTYVKPSETKAAATYTPGISEQTILSAGTYCSGEQKIAAIPVYSGAGTSGGAYKRRFETGFSRVPSYVAAHLKGEATSTGDYGFFITDFIIYGGMMYYTAVDSTDGKHYNGTIEEGEYGYTLTMNGTELIITLNDSILASPSYTLVAEIGTIAGGIAFPSGRMHYIVL